MEGLITGIGKGTFGNAGTPLTLDNLWRLNKTPIANADNPYANEAAMYADQANQLKGWIYVVDNAGQFWYKGTTTASSVDYEQIGGNGKDIILRSPNTSSTIYFYDDETTEVYYTFIRYNADTNFLEFGSSDGEGEVISARIDRGKQDWEFQDFIQILKPGRGVVLSVPSFTGDGNSFQGRYELRINEGGVLEVWSLNSRHELVTKIWGSDTGGSTPKPPVDETYADVSALLADQNNQEKDYFYEVTDASGLTAVSSGAAVLLYNASTPTGTENDYVIIWSENQVYITNITEIPNRSYNDLQDLPYSEIIEVGARTIFQLTDINDLLLVTGDILIPENVFSEGDVLFGLCDNSGIPVSIEAENGIILSKNKTLVDTVQIQPLGFFKLTKSSSPANSWYLEGDNVMDYFVLPNDAGVLKKVTIVGNTLTVNDL